jgi:hypothetical protein|tara:strand:+ start:4130 stop:4327 length:198 start_codon:yes stop_codon:yes gene_type:complete
MKHTIRVKCTSGDCDHLEEGVILVRGCCPNCGYFLWDPSLTPDEFTFTKRTGEEFYKLMQKEEIL